MTNDLCVILVEEPYLVTVPFHQASYRNDSHGTVPGTNCYHPLSLLPLSHFSASVLGIVPDFIDHLVALDSLALCLKRRIMPYVLLITSLEPKILFPFLIVVKDL